MSCFFYLTQSNSDRVCKWSSCPKQLMFFFFFHCRRGETRWFKKEFQKRKDCSLLSDIIHRESTSAKQWWWEAGSLFFFYMNVHILEAIKKTAGQNTLAWVNINRSSSLFLLDPCAWKQWVLGHFISRKRARQPVNIVSMTTIYFAGVARQACVVEWRLIDKNSRKDTFQFLMFLRDAALTGTAARPQWIPIALGVGRGALQWNLPAPLSLCFLLSPVLCIPPDSPPPQRLRWRSSKALYRLFDWLSYFVIFCFFVEKRKDKTCEIDGIKHNNINMKLGRSWLLGL